MDISNLLNDIEVMAKQYPSAQSALLPALMRAQEEYGYLSDEALVTVANALDIPRATVRGVATFHCMYMDKPAGRHLIQICTNVTCMLFGAETLLMILKSRFGLEPGGTTEDRRFTLMVLECIGACDAAPAMIIDKDTHTFLKAQDFVRILENYK